VPGGSPDDVLPLELVVVPLELASPLELDAMSPLLPLVVDPLELLAPGSVDVVSSPQAEMVQTPATSTVPNNHHAWGWRFIRRTIA